MSQVGGRGSNLWENRSWDLSNLDNSGGSDERSTAKPPDLGSKAQTPTRDETVASPGRKRGRVKKNEQESTDEVNEGKSSRELLDHEMHIVTERERRKKMRVMFSELQTLLPELPPKVDKSGVIDEAVSYIKRMEQTLHKLQIKKLEMRRGVNYQPSLKASREALVADQVVSSMAFAGAGGGSRLSPAFQTWTSNNLVLSVCGDQAQINICSRKKQGLLSAIFYVMEKHKIFVVSAVVSSDHNWVTYMIHARAGSASDQYPGEAFPMSEIFKLAAREIMLLAN
ncbi:hypothetical protein NMG60_11019709 [Bertholletia excelsa]